MGSILFMGASKTILGVSLSFNLQFEISLRVLQLHLNSSHQNSTQDWPQGCVMASPQSQEVQWHKFPLEQRKDPSQKKSKENINSLTDWLVYVGWHSVWGSKDPESDEQHYRDGRRVLASGTPFIRTFVSAKMALLFGKKYFNQSHFCSCTYSQGIHWNLLLDVHSISLQYLEYKTF